MKFKRGEIDYLLAKDEDYATLKKGELKGAYTVYRLGSATGSNFLFFNQNTLRDVKTGRPYVDSSQAVLVPKTRGSEKAWPMLLTNKA